MSKKIQLDLDELENQITELFKAIFGLKSKKDAIKQIIRTQKGLLDKVKV